MKKLFYSIGILAASLAAATSASATDWKEYKQTHFLVYYNEAPLDFVKEVAEAAEDYYQSIARDLGFTRYRGWTWENRAKIYIYDSAEQYINEGGQTSWSHGAANVYTKTIRTYPSAHGFFDSTLPHEITHIIFREFIGFNAKVPPWFEEGVAMYHERAKRWGSKQVVKQAMDDNTFIPLPEMTTALLRQNADPNIIQLFYAESASVVYFLITEFGEQRFVRLCRKLQEGMPFETALKSVYVRFKSLEDLNKAWVEYVR